MRLNRIWHHLSSALKKSIDITDRLNSATALVTTMLSAGLGWQMSSSYIPVIILPLAWGCLFTFWFVRSIFFSPAEKPSHERILLATRLNSYLKELAHIQHEPWPVFDRKMDEIISPLSYYYEEHEYLKDSVSDLSFSSKMLYVSLNVQNTDFSSDEIYEIIWDISKHIENISEDIKNCILFKRGDKFSYSRKNKLHDIIHRRGIHSFSLPVIGDSANLDLMRYVPDQLPLSAEAKHVGKLTSL